MRIRFDKTRSDYKLWELIKNMCKIKIQVMFYSIEILYNSKMLMCFLFYKTIIWLLKNAFVLISCELNEEIKIIEKLEKIKNVEYVQRTLGAYDIVVKLSATNSNKLKETVKNKIREVKNIQFMLTLTELTWRLWN